MRRAVALSALVLVLVAGACSDDDGDDGGGADATPTTEATADTTADVVTVEVLLVDEAAFAAGTEPYVVAVEREVDAADVAQGALDALFAGPTDDEVDDGLALVASGATGATVVSIADGVATVQLEGGCDSGGSTLTIADQLIPTLTGLDDVDEVTLLDPEGGTADPDTPGSRPACLEP